MDSCSLCHPSPPTACHMYLSWKGTTEARRQHCFLSLSRSAITVSHLSSLPLTKDRGNPHFRWTVAGPREAQPRSLESGWPEICFLFELPFGPGIHWVPGEREEERC